ncbi:importin-4-like isoform X8 [Brienomyrus brachyistius]|nr:importin-4-like isoform X5 [Brienomyrus brachyistius]XP_048856763.1 importin-4-like isoform X6 [Brienomyrus brachyistius]XP_048856764.1 importin-4-like isoform X7 [Brienomyrus brachyistius]XP_048856766.1 importin-4-like isoform X8 [Brienomyrus brachyistius]
MSGSHDPQIRQSAAVMLRMRVKKHWKKISPDHRESLKAVVLQAFQQETEHMVRHSLSQLSAVLVKHETPDRWPELLNLLNQSTKSSNPQDRQVGLLLLSKVVDSNPEAFKPHYRQLLRLFDTVLQDLSSPTALYYCILTLTAITAHTGQGELNMMRSLVPRLSVAIRHLVKADQDQASEAMEVFDEMMESDISVMVPHVSDIVRFWLEIAVDASLSDSLRMKALSCTAFLIRLRSKVILKQKLLSPILQTVFPVLSAAPPPGQEDPEDQEDAENGEDAESPKHLAAQVIDTLAMHLPPEKLFQQLTPFMQACLSSKNPYEQKAGLMCLAVLAEGCADHMRTRMLPAVLQTVCQSLSDSNQLVRSAGLFALGQFSEHLQPDISKYCTELMPLLMGYLSGLNLAKTGHVTKAFYALENFLENLGVEIQPYLPTLMETMLGALNTSGNLKIKELAVSAIGAIANAAKEMLVPYFPPVIESLKAFLMDIREEVRCLQTQALDTLSVLARTVGKDVFGPLASECVQLGLNLMDAVDDPDLRRCTYSLFSAVSTVSPESLTPHLSTITSAMLLSLKSTEGVTAHPDEEAQFVLLDDDDDDDDSGDVVLDEEGEKEGNESDIAGFSVENAYIDEKEDACDALGELAFNTGTAFLPFLEVTFQQVFQMRDFPHEDVRRAAFAAMGQFCCAQHKVWQGNPTEDNHQALQKFLSVVLPSFLEAVRQEHERQVVMAVLESMNGVLKSCQGEALRPAARLGEISQLIRSVLKKKTACQDGGGDGADDEQQAEFDAMLQEFAGEGIPLLASAVPADTFYPYLNELLPLVMSKAKSSCTVAERSFAQGTLAEIMQSLAAVSGGRAVAGRLSNRLLPVMMAGVRDSDPEVRNNSVFGLGSLAKAAGPIITENYPTLLSLFSSLLSKESDRRVIDNVCGALCRMITSNTPCVPLDQVFPAVLSHLPLKVDLEENRTVFDCMAFLYSHNPSLVVSHIKAVLSASSHIIGTKDLDADGQDTLLLFLRNLAQHHSREFQCAVMSLPSERKTALVALVTPV